MYGFSISSCSITVQFQNIIRIIRLELRSGKSRIFPRSVRDPIKVFGITLWWIYLNSNPDNVLHFTHVTWYCPNIWILSWGDIVEVKRVKVFSSSHMWHIMPSWISHFIGKLLLFLMGQKVEVPQIYPKNETNWFFLFPINYRVFIQLSWNTKERN